MAGECVTRCQKLFRKAMKIGYARVSTDAQELGRQIQDLEKYGCEVIFQEKISGGKTKRPELDSLLARLQPKDVLVVHKLDRLGRSLMHLIQVLTQLKERGVTFVSLSDSIDTNSAQGMLMFQMLGAFAEFERAMISERVVHGLKFAKSQGRVGGRRNSVDRDKVRKYIEKGWGASQIATKMKTSRQTIHNIINEFEESVN
jgi:DNA invertase Pin-like site-specific DNA recombinase